MIDWETGCEVQKYNGDLQEDIALGTYITYGENEKHIVEAGVSKIKEALFGDDINLIRSLLFCLDLYLDPFYKKTLPYEDDIYDLLQELVVTSDNDDVIEDALQLIGDYTWGALPIIEKNFDKIKETMKPEARYVLNRLTS